MYNLLNFLIKNSSWFVFIFLEVICFYFIFSENAYQRSVFLNSSNAVSGKVYETVSDITSYFGLRDENTILLEQNGDLRNRVASLENYIFELEKDSLKTTAFLNSDYERENDYIAARVISNTVNKAHNYILVNKGSKDGVVPGVGVISQNGIVGEVRVVSANYSIVQSMLNTNSTYNCMLLNSNTFGPVEWKEMDPRYVTMSEYPTYKEVAVGDTIVTSGHSDIFPNGVLVGTVSNIGLEEAVNQYKLTIELSTDFYSLKNVLIVKQNHLNEIRNLEKQVSNVQD